jgi:hypothetical protein
VGLCTNAPQIYTVGLCTNAPQIYTVGLCTNAPQIYTVGLCTNALQISRKSLYYSLFISPIVLAIQVGVDNKLNNKHCCCLQSSPFQYSVGPNILKMSDSSLLTDFLSILAVSWWTWVVLRLESSFWFQCLYLSCSWVAPLSAYCFNQWRLFYLKLITLIKTFYHRWFSIGSSKGGEDLMQSCSAFMELKIHHSSTDRWFLDGHHFHGPYELWYILCIQMIWEPDFNQN